MGLFKFIRKILTSIEPPCYEELFSDTPKGTFSNIDAAFARQDALTLSSNAPKTTYYIHNSNDFYTVLESISRQEDI